jgi:hypothetical protein
MFQMFQSYVAISVFILQVASVLSICCICFTHMLQLYVLNVLSASDVCCIQTFHISTFKVESHGGMSQSPGDGATRAMGQWSGRAVHLGSCGRGVLVLMLALGSRPLRERGGAGGRNGGCGVSRGCV